MTGPVNQPEGQEFDPGSMASSSFGLVKAVWYRRPWVLVTAVVVLVVAVSVITDLPHPISGSQDVGDQNSAIREINSDLQTCSFSIKEAFSFYRKEVAHQIDSSNFNLALKTLLPEDAQSCSFVSSAMTDMTGNLQIVDTTAGKQIEKMRLAIVRWINHDARYAINDIIVLFTHPGNTKTLANLALQENYLAEDHQSALNYLAAADAALGVTLVNLKLPTLDRLPGT